MDSAGQPPPHKRARILAARGEDDYMHGNITMIEVHNFMTYSHIATKPGPRLNLVIGPNGTGKSSLVCAIAIGLGGEPQLLGRAGHIGDYVKRGEESGWIKISLRGHSPDETIVITRKINRQNKSEWLLNGKPASKRLVQETVQQFNIQVGNLTQFLPQDRVCEFAKMSPVQLLEETEKAVGDPELSQQHCTLSRRNYELKQHQVSVRQLENTLNQHKANNAELEKDVERVQQRNGLYERAEAMKKKLPWLKYDREKHTYMDAKEREKEAKKKLQEAMKQIVELKAPIEEKKHRKVKLENTCKKLRDENSRNESKCKEIGRKENELRVQVKAKRSEIEELHRSEATRQEKIRNAERAVAEAEEELANLPITEPPREEIEQLGGRIHDLELAAQEKRRCIQERTGFQNQKKAQIDHCNRRLAEIQNVTNQRLQLLKNSGAQKIFEAYQWVEQHRHEFGRDVYGPVLLEVNVPNKDLAAYVEGHVAYYIWKAFITQDGEDRDLLVRNLKQYDVPIINFTGEESQVPGPSITPQMESLGIEGRLDQVISAPQVVKDVLIGQFALNHSFIGTAETNRRADEACRLGIRDLWTPENHFRWQDSRYGGPMSASVNPVRAARLFSPSVDTRELNELERKKTEAVETLERQRDELKAIAMELRQHEDQAAVLHKQREEIVNRVKLDRKKRQDLKNKIEQRKRKLESFEKEEDLQSAEHRLRNAVANLNEKRCMKALELKDLLVQSVNDQILYNVRYLAAAELDANVKAMEKEFRAHEAVGIQSQQDYDACKAEFASCRARLEAAKDAAEKIARITPELQASFENMPNTVEDLEDAIEDCIAQARTVLCPNPNVLEEYERRCQQITDASAKLEVEKAALDSCSEEIERIQTVWLTKLREIVTKINSTFSRNFKQMAVAGEVTLDEQGMDFDRYGIHIKVKFRETGELQVLSAHHQSGGERSVSTILYLVSLQDLTHCPFRVVDEINQGMDPINERKMFQQLVKAASQPNTPQCFLLTPKLLPELDYSEACSILDIMNGPWIQRASEVWSSGDCWSEVSRTTIQPVS